MYQAGIQNLVGEVTELLPENGNDGPVLAYTNTYRNRQYFNIRRFYRDDNGHLCPGKGLAVAADQRNRLLAALRALPDDAPQYSGNATNLVNF